MAVRIDHVTLAIDTVATLTFTGSGNKVKVEILSAASAVDPVYFNIGTTAAPPADPTLLGDDQESVASLNGACRIAYGSSSSMSTVVKLIAHVAHIVRVELLGD